jgi:hypothetical protein
LSVVTGAIFFSVVWKTWLHGNSNTENYYGLRSLEQGWRKELNSALDKVKLKTAIEPNRNFRQPETWQDRQLVNRNNF